MSSWNYLPTTPLPTRDWKEFEMSKPKKPKQTHNVITVFEGVDPLTLAIDNIDVADNSIVQTIVWELDKSLQAGDFTGFSWEPDVTNKGAFGNPEISSDGNSLTITNLNHGKAAKGNASYTITVTLNGKKYLSNPIRKSTKGSPRTERDPMIINK